MTDGNTANDNRFDFNLQAELLFCNPLKNRIVINAIVHVAKSIAYGYGLLFYKSPHKRYTRSTYRGGTLTKSYEYSASRHSSDSSRNYVRPNPKTVDVLDFSEKGVVFNQELYTMEDDTRYLVTFSELNKRYKRPASDIVALENSAWLTRFGGLNLRRQLALGHHFRIPSIFIGVQQNFLRKGDLEKTARDSLEIRKHVGERLGYHATATVLLGLSRGAMLDDCKQAVAHEHGLNIIYMDNLVSCQPNGLHIAKTMKDVWNNLSSELQSFQSLKIPLSLIPKYAGTFDPNVPQQLKEFRALTNGKLGKLVRANPHKEDIFGYSLVYAGDILSRGEEFVDLYKDYPYVRIDLVKGGGHVKSISEANHKHLIDRFETVTNILHNDPSIINLGARALYKEAVRRNPIFAKNADDRE